MAEKNEQPIVIAFDIPDAEISGEVRDLCGKRKKLIFLPISSKDRHVEEMKRRFGISKPGAVLTDEFGNVLKGGLKNSEEIVEAYYERDELTEDLYGAWSTAIEKGEGLIEKKLFPDAAQVLKVFAFAAGTEKAKKGKHLFDKTASIASEEFDRLFRELKNIEVEKLDQNKRKSLQTALKAFAEKWPDTPASFEAYRINLELALIMEI